MGFLNDPFIHEAADFQNLLFLVCSFADQLDNVSLRTRSSRVDLTDRTEAAGAELNFRSPDCALVRWFLFYLEVLIVLEHI